MNMYSELENILPAGIITYNEPLKKHCTFKIGGPADVLATPENTEHIKDIISYAVSRGIRVVILGNGSNVLFSDNGVRGIVIKLGRNFSDIEIIKKEKEYAVIRAQAGALLSGVSMLACNEGLTGLEFAYGIPGSVGGSVLMNAGAYDGELSQCVTESCYIDGKTLYVNIKKGAEHMFSYRFSSYQNQDAVILSADFKLKYGDKNEIHNKMKELMKRRISKQPLEFPSAGSAFKRPAGDFAARLIDECGLRGYSSGNAAVSEKHCGFIINKGEATCSDVLHVIEYVKDTVFKRTGILLEPEIRIIGEYI